MNTCQHCNKEEAIAYCLACEAWFCLTCFIFRHIGYYVNNKPHLVEPGIEQNSFFTRVSYQPVSFSGKLMLRNETFLSVKRGY